jgi:hypothetical protein
MSGGSCALRARRSVSTSCGTLTSTLANQPERVDAGYRFAPAPCTVTGAPSSDANACSSSRLNRLSRPLTLPADETAAVIRERQLECTHSAARRARRYLTPFMSVTPASRPEIPAAHIGQASAS